MPFHQQLIALWTLMRREVLRMFRLWPQTLLPTTITTILYFIIFGNVIGTRIGMMEGHNYITFISPGLIMLAIITGAFSGTVASFFSMKFIRSIEELLVSPMPDNVILLGFIAGGILRGIIAGFLVLLITLFFTHLHLQSLSIVMFVTLLAASMFSLLGFINAVFAKKFDDIAIVPTFILTPLTYLGGVFYSITLLPKGWQLVSMLNPIVYIINAFRYGVLGVEGHYITAAFAVMLLINAGLYAFALALLRRGTGLRD